MSAGLALIAPNSGGITTYADNSNAWLCAPEGACFAAAARELREAAALRRIKLTTARERALEYDWGNVTSRYLALYRELHAVTSGQQEAPALAPIGWSTPGDAMGRELYADLPGA
jgi:glycosyltransferase involved in cell wall biosynthesis